MEFTPVAHLERRLRGLTIGHKIHFLECTDSTNTVALSLAREGASEGEVVITDRQLKGRGRLAGRRWQSPPGRNLYMSVILRPPLPPSRAASLTLVAGVSVAEALDRYCPDRVELKWPNDVLIEGKKVCGILTEMMTRGKEIECVVVGIGVNILMKRDEFDPEFRDKATSLLEASDHPPDRRQVTEEIIRKLDHWYGIFLRDGFRPVRERWLHFASLLGRHVTVENLNSRERGVVAGIDEEGALLLRGDDGRVVSVLSGDVSPS